MEVRTSLAALLERTVSLRGVAEAIAAESPERVEPHLVRQMVKAARDVGHHAAQVVGYFDGFAARGRMTRWLDEALSGPAPEGATSRQVAEVFVVACRSLESALGELLARSELALSGDGPRRPGVERTCAWAMGQLERAEQQLRSGAGGR